MGRKWGKKGVRKLKCLWDEKGEERGKKEGRKSKYKLKVGVIESGVSIQ